MNRRSFLLATTSVAISVTGERVVRAGVAEIAVIVNKASGVHSMTRGQLAAIFKAKSTEFPNGTRATPVNLPPENAYRREFDLVLLGMTPSDMERFWVDSRIRSGVGSPRRLPSPDAVLHMVASDTSTLGYVPRADVNDKVVVVALVRDGKVIPT